jgi:N-acyl-D-amino-acid deacylase
MKSVRFTLSVLLAGLVLTESGCADRSLFLGHPAPRKTKQAPAASVVFDREEIPNVEPLFKDAFGKAALLPPDRLPITGVAPASLKPLDEKICDLLRRYDVPGCSVAIARDGHLIAARAYGWADIKRREAVQPDSLFRLASVSKIITAVAALKMCDDGKLSLSTKVFPLLNYAPFPIERRVRDPRLDTITVLQLLQSTAGWNREWTGDPMFAPHVQAAAQMLSPSLRADPEIMITYWINTHQLDFDPGTMHSYSNLAYAVLGQVIGKVSGNSYPDFVRTKILDPMGVRHMQPGRTVVRAPGEVTFYPFAGEEMNQSVFPNYLGNVPLPYGGDFSLEAMEADTGWLASAPALALFACTALGDRKVPSPLSAKTRSFMVERPSLKQWDGSQEYFACGWEVHTDKDPAHALVMKEGSLAGSMAFVGRSTNGTTVAWLINSRPLDYEACNRELTELILKSVDDKVKSSDGDLFEKFN